jgi:hypothetical protein
MVSIVYLVELNRVRKNRIGRHLLCYKLYLDSDIVQTLSLSLTSFVPIAVAVTKKIGLWGTLEHGVEKGARRKLVKECDC